MKTKIKNNLKAIILGLIFTLGMGYVAAQTFTGPTCSPTDPVGCNVPAPINVGSSAQSKIGILTLVDLVAANFKLTNPDGTLTGITAGKVLTTDANGVGTWQSTNKYEMRCLPWVAGAANDRCCKVRVLTGEVMCRQGVGPDGFTSSWTEYNYPFAAEATVGKYSIELIEAVAGYRAVVLCRLNADNGSAQCKASNAGYGWAVTGPWTGLLPYPPFQ